MPVQLVPMIEDDYKAFLEYAIQVYAEENVRAGYWTSAEAVERSRQDHERLLPQGLSTPDHHLYTIFDPAAQLKVGILWLAVDRRRTPLSGFIYDIEIQEAYRHQGYGRQAMLALEDIARELGCSTLMLHVFAHNGAARSLYEQIGYQTTSLNMAKVL